MSQQASSDTNVAVIEECHIETLDWQQSNPICNRCLTLLSEVFKQSEDHSFGFTHSTFTETPSSCPVCRRAYSAFLQQEEAALQSWNWTWKSKGNVTWDVLRPSGVYLRGRKVVYFHAECSQTSIDLHCAFYVSAQLMDDAIYGLPELSYDVDDSSVNIKLVLEKFNECLTNHTQCSQGRSDWLPLDLIHIGGSRIQGHTGMRYLAVLGPAPQYQVQNLAQQLGFEYYLIDSLDRKVYLNAELTVVACNDTIQHDRDLCAQIGFKVDLSSLGDAPLLKQQLRFVWSDSGLMPRSARQDRHHIFQYLAPRSLTIWSGRVRWACDQMIYVERFGGLRLSEKPHFRRYAGDRRRSVTLVEAEKKEFMRAWYNAVSRTSEVGACTEPIAEEMSGVMGRLIYGHWEEHFEEQLVWQSAGSSLYADIPSWSWMSRLGGQVWFPGQHDVCIQLTVVLSIEPLRIRGHLRGCLEQVHGQWPPDNTDQDSWDLDLEWSPDSGAQCDTGDVELLHSITYERNEYGGVRLLSLVLKEVAEDVYQRVGLCIQRLKDDDPMILQALEYNGDFETAKRRSDFGQQEIVIL